MYIYLLNYQLNKTDQDTVVFSSYEIAKSTVLTTYSALSDRFVFNDNGVGTISILRGGIYWGHIIKIKVETKTTHL